MMEQIARLHAREPSEVVNGDDRLDYVPLMLRVMDDSDISLRALALRSGVGKSRLGQLLHRDPQRRVAMSLLEFQRLLRSLDIEPIEAFVQIETMRGLDPDDAKRFAPIIRMLCSMFRELPANLIAALNDVEGVDGSEVRPEWAPVLQRAVIKRLVLEIAAVAQRRLAIGELPII